MSLIQKQEISSFPAANLHEASAKKASFSSPATKFRSNKSDESLKKSKQMLKVLKSFATEFDFEVLLTIKDKVTSQVCSLSTSPNSFTLETAAKA